MLALRKLTPGAGEPDLADVPVPLPGPGQARVAVTAAGICGTDLHILHDEYSFRPPVTMGHEVAGIVDALGDGVDPAWLAALVAPETAFRTCGVCRWCRTGRPMLCRERLSIGSGVDGGFAAYLVVPAVLLHRLPAGLDDQAAALTEPLACVCNALLDPPVVQPGDRVVVIGAGAVGMLAAQVARAAGGLVELVGTAADAERLAVARTIGLATSSIDLPADRDRLAAEGEARSIDVVVECAGVEAAARMGLGLVRPGGHYVQVGLLPGEVRLPFGLVVARELQVRATFGSSPASWLRAVAILEAGAVQLKPLVSAALPLRDWRQAFTRLEERTGIKTVLDPRLD
jgi:L-iditol 2-dehydrogenase